MLSNFLRIAFRQLFRHKVFSFINIFGLAIGLAASLLIYQYARFELSYDRFEPDAGRIFRLEEDRYTQGTLATQWASATSGIGPAVKEACPEVLAFTRLMSIYDPFIVSYKDHNFREDKMFYTNDDFLSMFGYKAAEGSTANALKDVNTAVLTTSAARRYFGSEYPIGKFISLNKEEKYKVTAVVQDPPPDTHLKFDILLSFSTMLHKRNDIEGRYDFNGFYTYIQLRPGADPAQLEKKIPAVVQAQWAGVLKANSENLVYHLQPLFDIHLYSHYMYETEVNGNGKAVYFLLVIAAFIVIIAWINYVNLATARAVERAKEVGIRKVLGSLRRQLIGQFFFEAFLINGLATLLALLLVVSCLPLFNSLTGQRLPLSILNDSSFWGPLCSVFFIGTLLSGAYPALVLSSFKPISVLKGRLSGTGHGAFLRQALVVGQFTASIVLMVGTFAVYRQLNFMQRQDLGVNIDQTLVLRGPRVIDSTYQAKFAAFRTELARSAGVPLVTASTDVPGSRINWSAGGIRLAGTDNTQGKQYRIIGIDYDFMQAYGLKIVKGRNFSRSFTTDPNAVLFNEAAIKELGFATPEAALNKKITFWGNEYTIIGVVSNHHQESLQQAYDSYIYRLLPNTTDYYSLRLAAGSNPAVTISEVQKQWASFFPDNPFEYFFLDEHYAQQYAADRQFGRVFGLFSGLAIFVSCLGLLGLAAFVTTQRTREIGIRKIIGAGLPSLLLLLTRDFIRPVLLAFLVAVPLTWYGLHTWLESYAFRISISPWLFLLPGLLILAIALLTISTQTIKAAAVNPVKNLRVD